MLHYIRYYVWWIGWRLIVSLSCIFTIQHIIHRNSGLWIDTGSLLLVSVLLILAIIIWSAKPDYQEPFQPEKLKR